MQGSISERFWAKVDQTGDCWIWTGARITGRWGPRYGSFGVGNKRTMGAHRVSYELANGPIPTGMWVLHSCDNPPCVRAAHLFLGTPADNARDRHAKGRSASHKGSANQHARLTETQVIEIRARYRRGGVTQTDLGRAYGLAQATVSNIVTGCRWAHV